MDYTKLGTMDPAVFDERQHLAGLVRDTNYALRIGIFETDLPQNLTRGFVGRLRSTSAASRRSLSLSTSPS